MRLTVERRTEDIPVGDYFLWMDMECFVASEDFQDFLTGSQPNVFVRAMTGGNWLLKFGTLVRPSHGQRNLRSKVKYLPSWWNWQTHLT
jgi:hypothetical protein